MSPGNLILKRHPSFPKQYQATSIILNIALRANLNRSYKKSSVHHIKHQIRAAQQVQVVSATVLCLQFGLHVVLGCGQGVVFSGP